MYIEIIVTKILTNICLEYELTKLKFKCKTLNNQTASKLLELMPFKSTVSKWGKEIYFDVPKNDIREDKSAKVLFNLGCANKNLQFKGTLPQKVFILNSFHLGHRVIGFK